MSQAAADDASRWICSGGPLQWPDQAPRSLYDALQQAIASGNRSIIHVDQQGQTTRRTYAELLRAAGHVAQRLQATGLRPGDAVLLQLRDPAQFLLALWGCFVADLIPAPLSVPATYQGQSAAQRRLKDAWHLLKQPRILTDTARAAELDRLFASDPQMPPPRQVLDLAGLVSAPLVDPADPTASQPLSPAGTSEPGQRTSAPDTNPHPAGNKQRRVPGNNPSRAAAGNDSADQSVLSETASPRRGGDDVALVLLTSGSTGAPKGVMLSHRNLLSMAAGTAQQNQLDHRDVTLNWLPLDHVGAVSFLHLMPTLLGCQQVHVATDYVLRDLLLWLDLIHRHRATISWAPNFAFRLISQQRDQLQNKHWDLAPLRFLVNAGEPVVRETVREFWQLLEPFGLRLGAIRPAFGMSETCSGITWSTGLCVEQLDSPTHHIDLGPPIPGASLRIADEANRPLPEGHEGRLQIRAASLFQGYINRPDLTRQAFTPDGWFDTGDLGIIRNGRLAITGRAKEVIIIHGVHYASQEIEAAVDALPQVATSYTAACAVRPPGSDTDRLAVFFSPATAQSSSASGPNVPTTGDPDPAALVESIRRAVIERVGVAPDFIIPLPQHEIPKTAIGKIQRSLLRQRFERGEISAATVPPVRRGATKPAAPRDERTTASVSSETTAISSSASSTVPGVAVADIEGRVIDLWQEVLQLQAIGPDDSFFELGGRSIDLPRLEARLKDRFHLDVTSADLLAYPTPAALARWIAERLQPQAVTTADRPLTPAPRHTKPADHAASSAHHADPQPVAIVGMACRFPGADDVDQFWNNLCGGRETIRFFSVPELLAQGVSAATLRDPNYVRAAPWLDGIDCFDAPFFGYNDHEAALIDPQQRLFLECAWHALENSATDPTRFEGRIGVFGSAGLNIYMNYAGIVPELSGDFQQALTSNAVDFLATRTAYKLNLTGPSLTVQTACSSGLYAVHLACQSLAAGQCEMALAGGASIWTLEPRGYRYHEGGLASPDGHCRAFDARAQGMVFGNGVGLVVLKPLSAALRDGNPIHAVILASAVNNDGAMKAGFTTTGMQGQADVVTDACRRAGVDPATIGMVECHGTGTVLGDAIEATGLTQAFRRWTDKRGYCAIGSVKTNIGHMGVACGIAGLIKATLAVEHGQIPPSLHFETPNPQFDFASSPFYVNTRLTAWPESLAPRRAGVTSLGLGGANVHVIIEQPPQQAFSSVSRPGSSRTLAEHAAAAPASVSPSPGTSSPGAIASAAARSSASPSREASMPPPQLLVVSAKTPDALRRALLRLAEFLERRPHIDLQHVAATLQRGRQAMPYRAYVVARWASDAAAALRRQAEPSSETPSMADAANVSTPAATSPGPVVPRRLRWVLVFDGPATLRPDDVAALYAEQPLFQQTVDRLAARLQPRLKQQISRWLHRAAHTAVDAAPPQPPEQNGGHLAPSANASDTPHAAQPPFHAACVFQYALAQLWLDWIAQPPAALAADDEAAAVASALNGALDLPSWLNQYQSAVADDFPRPVVPGSSAARSSALLPHIAVAELSDFLASHAPCHVVALADVFADTASLSNTTSPAEANSSLMSPGQHSGHRAERVLGHLSADGASLGTTSDDDWAAASQAGVRLLAVLGQCWLAGLEINWHALHPGGATQRISLPGYPFEPRRCWIDRPSVRPSESLPSGGVQRSGGSVELSADAQRPESEPRRLPLPASHGPRSAVPEPSDRGWFYAHLAQQSASQPSEVLLEVIVRAVNRFVDPANRRPLESAADVGFVELGMTSRWMVELIEHLAQGLDQPLSPTLALECPTPRQLADRLSARYLAASSNVLLSADAATQTSESASPLGLSRLSPGSGPGNSLASQTSASRPGSATSRSLVDKVARLNDLEVLRALRNADRKEAPGQ